MTAKPTLKAVSMKQVVRHKGRGSRFGRKPTIDLKKVLVLDTGSTLHSFANSDFVKGIQVSPTKMVMTTNAGQMELHLLAEVPGINEEVWYDPEQITNILSFGVLVDHGIRITYDSSVEDAFFVHFPNQVFKFVRKAGIYVREPNKAWVNYVRQQKGLHNRPEDPADNAALAQLEACPAETEADTALDFFEENTVETVASSRKNYTQQQYDKAKLARSLSTAMCIPPDRGLKRLLRQLGVARCPVNPSDLDRAMDIFGKDVRELKGKSVRRQPPAIEVETIDIPRRIIQTHQYLDLCIDIMFIMKCGMLTGIDKSVYYRSVAANVLSTKDGILIGLQRMARFYNRAGFVIRVIHANQQFKPIMGDIEDELHIAVNWTHQDEHVDLAERNNRTIQERVRAVSHGTPFKKMPPVMTIKLTQRCTEVLNMIPPKNGVSEFYSPYMIMHR
jgi:hypothetical protein